MFDNLTDASHDDTIRKAAGGDEEALHIVLLLSPAGAMGDMPPKEFVERLHKEPSFRAGMKGSKEEPTEVPDYEGCEPEALLKLEKRGCLKLSDGFRVACEKAVGDGTDVDPDALLADLDDKEDW